MTVPRLTVYLHGDKAGTLTRESGGALSFSYAPSYLRAGAAGISLSLPVREEPYRGDTPRAFFSGLLPDEGARERLARHLGVSRGNPFALLEAIGGDCAGALSFYPEGETPPVPGKAETEKLDAPRLKEILAALSRKGEAWAIDS